MSERKGSTILLTVIGIATLLVTLVGATFAYFTANVNDLNKDKTNVTVTAAKLGKITYTQGSKIELDNVYPGTNDTVEFSIQSETTSTVPMAYNVYLVTENNSLRAPRTEIGETEVAESSNLVASLTAAPEKAGSLLGGAVNTEVALALAAFKADETGDTDKYLIGTSVLAPAGAKDTWTLKVELKETGEDQDTDEGRNYTGYILVEANDQYTQQSVYGNN